MISTNLAKNYWFYRLVFALVRPFTKSLQQGASTSIYCATANELTGLTGLYFNNNFVCEPSKLAQNEVLARNLWNESEKLIEIILKDGNE
jgi:WW domain-containing oxidoreductase